MSSQLLSGKAAIVTGGGTLFGEAVAKTLIADGAKVLIVEINKESGELAAKNCGASFIHADITDDAAIAAVVEKVMKDFGRIDILVNLACSYDDAGSATTRAQWINTLNVNVASAAILGEAVRPHMAKQGGGSIINLTSISSGVAQIGRWAYPVSKAAIVQLTRNMAMDYAPDKIRVNAVSPGWTWSAIMNMLAHVDKRLAWMEKRTEHKHARGTNIIPFSIHNVDELLTDMDLTISAFIRFNEWLLPINPKSYAKIGPKMRKRLGLSK